eukprot:CAMPEP_0113556982 /NCGR_PEP_ID=MMETSP0015_2-20120614/17546_1 /TAXON_ID=2838 /ORGANISM="Odontella" /LENGTH=55 /DNA_ID=CAMNT_0000458373 /DNA_START=1357 /DNA_END=1524 /DNA_ORIENTATION=+ /assembly_acc=CAM_ASM_000160
MSTPTSSDEMIDPWHVSCCSEKKSAIQVTRINPPVSRSSRLTFQAVARSLLASGQ